MKKLLAMLMVLAMMLAMVACNNDNGDNSDGTGTKKPTSSTPVTEGDTSEADTSKAPEAEPDYLQFAVSEGDYGDMFRNEGKWTGDRTTANQVMTVTGSSDTESVVEWKGVAAGKSFEYETKLRVDSFGGAYVSVIFDTETHTVNLKITESELVIQKDGGEEKVAHTTDADWHIYRFNVVDNSCKLWVDGVLVTTVTLPARTGTECRLAFATTKATFGANYVKVKTTEEGWVKPEDRPPETPVIDKWDYAEEFDGADFGNWLETPTDNGSLSMKDGVVTIANSARAEYKFTNKTPDYAASKHLFAEFKMKVAFADSNLGCASLFVYSGNGYRIHSQVSFNIIKVRNADGGWDSYTIDNTDEEYHVYAYELEINDDGATYKLFVDGVFVGTGNSHPMARDPWLEFINNAVNDNGAEMLLQMDYVKVALLD